MRDLARRHGQTAMAFAASLTVYLLTLCPTVYVEGSGELIGATCLLGTPHPTGYPLYCLFGRLVSLLPGPSAAWRIGLSTALASALAVAALAALLRDRGCHPWNAFGAALAFGFSATFWSQAVIAEVYGMAMLAAVLVAGWSLRALGTVEARSWLFLGFLMGVGLTTHLAQVLLWPGLVVLFLLRRPRPWHWSRGLPYLLGGGALGYSLVLYLPLRSGRGPGFHWGPLDSPSLLWDHLTGALYRSSFFSQPPAAMLLNANRWLHQATGEFHPLLAGLVLWGAWVAWRRDRGLAWFAGSAVVANLVMALNYQRDPNGMAVFFLVSALMLSLFLGMGMEELSRALGAAWGGPTAGMVGLLVPLVVLTAQLPQADRSGNRIAERYGLDILNRMPNGAILLSEGDDASFILDYLQRVEGKRPDVELYNRAGRGRDLLSGGERRLDPAAQARLRAQREARLIVESGRPVFFLFARGMPLPGYRFAPEGLAYRAWPEGTNSPPDLPLAEVGNAQDTSCYRDPWVRKIQANYWYMLGEREQARGRTGAALAAYQRAAQVAWDSRTMRYNVAAVLARRGHLSEAWDNATAAQRLDPYNPRVRELQALIRHRQQAAARGGPPTEADDGPAAP